MSGDLTEETYQEYCERTRTGFTPEMLERAALRQASADEVKDNRKGNTE